MSVALLATAWLLAGAPAPDEPEPSGLVETLPDVTDDPGAPAQPERPSAPTKDPRPPATDPRAPATDPRAPAGEPGAPAPASSGPATAPSGSPPKPTKPGPHATARVTRGEVLVEGDDAGRPPEKARKLHGEVRLGVAFGFLVDDPVAALVPGVVFDLRDVAPVRIRIAAPFRLRLWDREPDDPGVLRRRDWDEVGDYFAVLGVWYDDDFAFGKTGRVAVGMHATEQRNATLGHGSLVRGYEGGIDLDRRRTGLDTRVTLRGQMLGQRAELDTSLLAGDIAGSQILGGRVAGMWAGAGLGVQVVGDPTAPRAIARDAGDPTALSTRRAGQLQPTGRRGVMGVGLDLSYRATDRWRYEVVPYLDLVEVPRLGRGLHLGLAADGILGRRRHSKLGGTAELTVGSNGYDPAYFDVFYLATRWQLPLVATPGGRPSDLGDVAQTKYELARAGGLRGVGGSGQLRFSHHKGAFASLGYRARPGRFGQTFEARLGLALRRVDMSVLVARRGPSHAFSGGFAGTLMRLDLRVPVIRWLDVEASAGWLVAIRPDPAGSTAATGPTGTVTGAAIVLLGVAGRVPW